MSIDAPTYQAEHDAYVSAVAHHRAAFLGAAAMGNASLRFGVGTVRDYSGTPHNLRRPQTFADVLADNLDHGDWMRRAAQVLVSAAAGRGTQREAQQLLEDVAKRYAEFQADREAA